MCYMVNVTHTIGLRHVLHGKCDTYYRTASCVMVNVTHTIGLRHVLHGKCDTYYRTASCVTW